MWVAAGGVMLLMMLLYTYIDLQSNTVWSTNIWDLVIKGRLYDVYQYAVENLNGAPHKVLGGNILSLIPLAIWNLPIWIAQHFYGIRVMDNAWCMFYSHAYLVAWLVVAMYFADKIMKQMGIGPQGRCSAVFLGSTCMFVYTAIGYGGTNDIVSIAVFAMAIYQLNKGSWKWFIILTNVAVAFKPFCLIAAIGVIMLLDKNILRVIGKSISLVALTLIYDVIFLKAPGFIESFNSVDSNYAYRLFSTAFSVGAGKISLFAMGLVFVYIYLYMTKTPQQEKYRARMVVYAITMAYALLTLFTNTGYYRVIMVVPFLHMTMATHPANYRLNVILELFMGWGRTVMSCFSAPDSYSTKFAMTESPLLGMNYGPFRINSITDMFVYNHHQISDAGLPMAGGIFAAALVALVYLNRPTAADPDDTAIVPCEPWIEWLRVLEPLVYVGLTLVCYFY